MKKLLIVELLAVVLATILFLRFWPKPEVQTVYVPPTPIAAPPSAPPCQIPQAVLIINENNKKWKSLASDINITIYDRTTYHATAQLAYEKNKRFRLLVRSITGLESDIGSNDNYFWFWSRRLKPQALYYAKHENLFGTGLKTPFNPLWMMESLGMGIMDTEKATIEKNGNQIAVKEFALSPLREKISKVTLIENNRMIGHYLYRDSVLVASTEITQFNSCGGPKIMKIIWHEEQMQMTWEFVNPRYNVELNPQLWKIPSFHNCVELGKH